MEAHKNVRNQVNQLKRGLNRDYFTKAMNKAEGNIRNTWQVINKLSDRRSKTTNIPYIEIDGKTVTEPKEKVKELNNYFSRAGENLSKKFNGNVTSKTQQSNTVTSQVTSKRFRFWKVTVELDVWAIMQMKTKKSHGPDNISSFILQINCLHRFYSIFSSPFYYCYNILDGFYPPFFFRLDYILFLLHPFGYLSPYLSVSPFQLSLTLAHAYNLSFLILQSHHFILSLLLSKYFFLTTIPDDY